MTFITKDLLGLLFFDPLPVSEDCLHQCFDFLSTDFCLLSAIRKAARQELTAGASCNCKKPANEYRDCL